MVKKYWSTSQKDIIHSDCQANHISPKIEKEINRVVEILDCNYGSERDVESDYGGCVYLILSDEEKEHKKITKKYYINEEGYEFQDIIYKERDIKWVCELYITSTEYCITVIYKTEKRDVLMLNSNQGIKIS